ncbi:MAG: 3'-5' exonuclease, partial [Gammaproteobacteria bacterium]|nr:3'-5' exonuclease [Gammaproteobacteria bacterium]
IPALRKAGLEFQAVDIEGLVTRPEVQDLLALVRAVTHLADRTAWYALLRAPWCGLKLDALLILGGESDHRTLWECINDPQLIAQLDTDATARLERFRHIMAAVLEDIRCQPLSRTIESAWLQLGGPATLSEKNQLNNVMIVLEYLADAAQGVFMEDVSSLVRDLETLFAVPDMVSGNPVQLMTIHKAKGLEFDHVFLPGLGRKARSNQPELLLWMQLPQQQVPGDLILAPIRESGSKQAPIYDYVNSVEKRKQDNEDRRLLYVAVTRARKSLHLFGHANVRVTRDVPECYAPAGSFLHMLWPVVEPVYVNALSRHTERTPPEETIYINQDWKRFPADWSMPMPGPLDWSGKPLAGTGRDDRDEIEFEWAGELIRHVGSVVHRCLQRMADEGIENWNRSRIQASCAWFELQLRQLGVHGEHLPIARADVCNALNAFLEDDQGRWILSNDHLEARNEYGLTGVINNRIINVRIDRTFVSSDGTRWIIDYKTGRHGETDLGLFLDRELERYRGQLERYARLMRAHDERPIKLGLYFPLVQGWRSWDAGQ